MKFLVWIIFVSLILVSCARIGSPGGGPKDVMPPRFLKANPDTFAINVPLGLKEIRIDFDEYIVLKEASKQIIFSPPLKNFPTLYPSQNSPRKYIQINLKDSLLANTTYNINFGESIADFNEGNTLSMFNYVFSTGNHIDSLQLKGKLSSALSSEIEANTTVALYKKDSMEINLKDKPYYVTRTDSLGEFLFKYVHDGQFRLVAFTDKNSNLRYDADESELLGFSSDWVSPLKDSTYTMVLSENRKEYKALKPEFKSEGAIDLYFNGHPEDLQFFPISDNFPQEYIFYHKSRSDTAQIFFNPQQLNFKDSKERLTFKILYKDISDTLSILYNTKDKNILVLNLETKNPVSGDKIVFKSNNYLQKVDKERINIMKDTVKIDFSIDSLTADKRKLQLSFPLEFESKYSIKLWPGALTDLMEQTNDTLNYSFSTQAKNEYGNLKLTLVNPPKHPFFLQLMDKDKIVHSIYGNQSDFQFNHLPPKEYGFRILVDENENGQWDIADFSLNQQAEKTYLYNSTLLIRAFWDINETWKLP